MSKAVLIRVTMLNCAVLELTGELGGLKAELGSDMKGVTATVTELTNKLLTAELGTKTTKAELASLRSSLAGLTTNLISTKTQTDKIAEVRNIMHTLNTSDLKNTHSKYRQNLKFNNVFKI